VSATDRVVASSVAGLRARIAAAARRVGRDPASVRLVAATKTVATDRVRAAVMAGVTDVGENRAQELVEKAADLLDSGVECRWHFLGRLQRNKVRSLAPWVACWQSVDRLPLGQEIARRAPAASVLVEVNLAGEPQKGGCAPSAAVRIADGLRDLGLSVDGLMTVPPHDDDPRRWFAALRDLGGRTGVDGLSMGMSEDFEIAVEEGATIVRVGRALFGERRDERRAGPPGIG
jgi:PLP dependent protein